MFGRGGTKELWSNMKIYKAIRTLLFYWFNLKEFNLSSAKLNEENIE